MMQAHTIVTIISLNFLKIADICCDFRLILAILMHKYAQAATIEVPLSCAAHVRCCAGIRVVTGTTGDDLYCAYPEQGCKASEKGPNQESLPVRIWDMLPTLRHRKDSGAIPAIIRPPSSVLAIVLKRLKGFRSTT